MNEYFSKILMVIAIIFLSGLTINLLMNLEKKFFGTSNLYKAIGRQSSEIESPKISKIAVVVSLIVLVLAPILYKISCEEECKSHVQDWFSGK